MLFITYLFIQLVNYLPIIYLLAMSLLINTSITEEVGKCNETKFSHFYFLSIALAGDLEKAIHGNGSKSLFENGTSGEEEKAGRRQAGRWHL